MIVRPSPAEPIAGLLYQPRLHAKACREFTNTQKMALRAGTIIRTTQVAVQFFRGLPVLIIGA